MTSMAVLFVAGVLFLQLSSALARHIQVNITVPEFEVHEEDAYLCVSAVLPPKPHKLIGVLPHARQEVVHHILLYGCNEPHMAPKDGGETAVWRCDMQPVCDGPSFIFYGWGRNAPDLRLPDGVGYSVGASSGIKYIVAQVHYLKVRPPDDHSGVTLVLKPHAVPYAAGMLTYASWFEIPPGKKSHLVENTCCFKSHQPLTMFAVRVHTHVLGRKVYMNRETWNHTGLETLYTRNPQLAQSFVPSTRHMLWSGDRLTVTCEFDSSNKTTVTVAGGTHNDEMCNMYVMVYGKTPYLTMCSDSEADIREDSPGALPRGATLVLDPSPFWRPPYPDGTIEDPPPPPVADANVTYDADLDYYYDNWYYRYQSEMAEEDYQDAQSLEALVDAEEADRNGESVGQDVGLEEGDYDSEKDEDMVREDEDYAEAIAEEEAEVEEATKEVVEAATEAEANAEVEAQHEADKKADAAEEDDAKEKDQQTDLSEAKEEQPADSANAESDAKATAGSDADAAAAQPDADPDAVAKDEAEKEAEEVEKELEMLEEEDYDYGDEDDNTDTGTEAQAGVQEAEATGSGEDAGAGGTTVGGKRRRHRRQSQRRQLSTDPRGQFGDATSVAAAPDGSLWVLYRASGVWGPDTFDKSNRITRKDPVPEAVVVRMDADNGTVLDRWGANTFYLPHMISVDASGNVWVVDVGLHQVLKFNPKGELLLTVGKKLTPGTGKNAFCKPTQVSVLRDGRFLVADGYCNARVVMFDAQGQFLAQSDTVPPVVHSVLVDECEGMVYVASREMGAVLALSLDGDKPLKLAATYNMKQQGHGQAWALGFGPYGEQLALMWKEGQDARLVNVRFPQIYWTLPGTAKLSPHDFQLGGAPMLLSGAGDRLYAVYVASVGTACDTDCGRLRKFVLVPPGMQLPDVSKLPQRYDGSRIQPGDAHLLPGGMAIKDQPHLRDADVEAKEKEAAKEEEEKDAEGKEDEEGSEEGGAMVADDYDEDVEDDEVDAADYEKGKPMTTADVPLEKERFAVLVQDKQMVRQYSSVSGWAVALVLVLVVLMAYSVLRISKVSLAAYLGGKEGAAGAGGPSLPTVAPGQRGGAGGSSSEADQAGGKRQAGVWATAEGMLTRMRGGSGGAGGGSRSGTAARDVAAAREREKLLRSEP